MAGRPLATLAALVLVSACQSTAGDAPRQDTDAVRGHSPVEAVLGRPVVDGDCIDRRQVPVTLPDPRTLERTVRLAMGHSGWLPSRGYLGSAPELASTVRGTLIEEGAQSIWVLVAAVNGRRADRYFPITAGSGDQVWYRDASLEACSQRL